MAVRVVRLFFCIATNCYNLKLYVIIKKNNFTKKWQNDTLLSYQNSRFIDADYKKELIIDTIYLRREKIRGKLINSVCVVKTLWREI